MEQVENKLVEERREKLKALRAKGNAYPNDFRRKDFSSALHSQWGENVLLHILLIGFARYALHDITGQCGSVVGIGGHFTRREQHRALMLLQVGLSGWQVPGICSQDVLYAFLKTTAMIHQITQGNGLAKVV